MAQRYGYTLPKIEDDPDYEMLIQTKDPRQIFFGLEPDWIVNLPDKTIIKPIKLNENEEEQGMLKVSEIF